MQDVQRFPSPFQSLPRPVYFGQPGRRSFAFFHRPAGSSAVDHALLICPSFGSEDVNAYLSLRLLAEATARAGMPTLRLDYPGCGNAEGDADMAGLFQAWQDSIVDAVQALRQLSGVQRISVLGLRLGALLAALAAPRCGPLHDFIAVAPVVSGRAFVREMKALHMASLSGLSMPPPDAPTVFESGGFVMAEATHQALSAIDLLKHETAPASRMLLIERDDLPGPAAKWSVRLEALGTEVQQQTLSGYAAMMADPHRCTPPEALGPMVVGRLQASAGVAGLTEDDARPATPRAARPGLDILVQDELRIAHHDGIGAVREQPVFIGGDQALLGIMSRPLISDEPSAATALTKGSAILMINAGATRLIGPNRLHVALARQWAAQGHVVLRLDIAGLGDSPVRPGQPDNTVYSNTALQDVAEALAWLRAQPGVDKVVLMGLCSGAYHALKAAVGGLPMDALVMINPLTFFWKEGMSLDPGAITDARVALDMIRHRQSIWRRETWLKLLRGGLPLKRLMQIARQTLKWVANKLYRKLAEPLGLPMKDDLGRELKQVASRQVPMHFIFSDSDPGLAMLQAQGGAAVRKLQQQGRLSIQVIPHADHTFTLAAPRAQLQEVLKATVSSLSGD